MSFLVLLCFSPKDPRMMLGLESPNILWLGPHPMLIADSSAVGRVEKELIRFSSAEFSKCWHPLSLWSSLEIVGRSSHPTPFWYSTCPQNSKSTHRFSICWESWPIMSCHHASRSAKEGYGTKNRSSLDWNGRAHETPRILYCTNFLF